MDRLVWVAEHDRAIVPSDFVHDAGRIMQLMADDWEQVVCEPEIIREPGQEPYLLLPKWSFVWTEQPGGQRHANQVATPFWRMEQMARADPHLYEVRLAFLGLAPGVPKRADVNGETRIGRRNLERIMRQDQDDRQRYQEEEPRLW